MVTAIVGLALLPTPYNVFARAIALTCLPLRPKLVQSAFPGPRDAMGMRGNANSQTDRFHFNTSIGARRSADMCVGMCVWGLVGFNISGHHVSLLWFDKSRQQKWQCATATEAARPHTRTAASQTSHTAADGSML